MSIPAVSAAARSIVFTDNWYATKLDPVLAQLPVVGVKIDLTATSTTKKGNMVTRKNTVNKNVIKTRIPDYLRKHLNTHPSANIIIDVYFTPSDRQIFVMFFYNDLASLASARASVMASFAARGFMRRNDGLSVADIMANNAGFPAAAARKTAGLGDDELAEIINIIKHVQGISSEKHKDFSTGGAAAKSAVNPGVSLQAKLAQMVSNPSYHLLGNRNAKTGEFTYSLVTQSGGGWSKVGAKKSAKSTKPLSVAGRFAVKATADSDSTLTALLQAASMASAGLDAVTAGAVQGLVAQAQQTLAAKYAAMAAAHTVVRAPTPPVLGLSPRLSR